MKTIVITGTPASGKTTIANKVASRLGNASVVHVNDLIRSRHLFSSYDKDGTMIVKMAALKKEIGSIIKMSKGETLILEGHVLCDLEISGATAFVIREHLKTLISRMKKRGYGQRKMMDNVVSEAIDYCGVNAFKNYGNAAEVMNDAKAVPAILRMIKTGRITKSGCIDLLPELVPLIKKNRLAGA